MYQSEGPGIITIIIYLIVVVAAIAGQWKLYEKAGQPGWACIIPIYNIVVLLKIINKPIWWIALFFVPVANIIVAFMIYIELAKAFGKSAGYGVAMVFFGFIMIPLLGFGDAEYVGNEMNDRVDSFGVA